MFGSHSHKDSKEVHELPQTSRTDRVLVESSLTGFAFSQEENGVVTQSQLIRHYDSKREKPSGN